MQILMDDQPYRAASPGTGQTIGELAREACAARGDDDRLVVEVRCNGQTVADGELEAVLQSPAEAYRRVEFITSSRAGLVQGALAQAAELLQDASSNRSAIADLLNEGRTAEAMRELQGFFGACKHVQDSVLASAEALRLDLQSEWQDEMALSDVLAALRARLRELKEALENGDLVLVADLLRYELDEPVEEWLALINRLEAAADQQA